MVALLLAAVVVLPASRTVALARVERPVLAVAALDPAHVLLLEDDRLSVWRLTPSALVHEGDAPAPPPVERVRWPGGLIHAAAGEGSAWVLRSGWAEAQLVSREDGGGGLAIRSPAVALPWPGAPPSGVRFRAGTSLIEGRMDGLGDGPYMALAAEGGAAVDAEGRLRTGPSAEPDEGAEPLQVGSALAHPWPEIVIASSAAPAAPDALLVVHLGSPARVLSSIPVDGRVRAFASIATAMSASLIVAVEDTGGSRILRVDVPHPAEQP
jgi:hypothetical protein